ncbi:hypothetical protein WJX84_001780 [Apatococcus fuscideae]|uniref:Exportin-4 n=1 Tax=Apatococcus fuscideae TaxID=2026836 RepID=A0AAW1T3G0_9CHLO
MDHIQQVLERACDQFAVPGFQKQAEAVLLEFRQSHQPFAACQHVLQHSTHQAAQFQAALTLREAGLREWEGLGPGGQQGLRQFLLSTLLRDSTPHGAIVQGALSGAFAVLLKRGWLAGNVAQQQAWLGDVEAIAASSQHLTIRSASIWLLEAVITEFNPATASAMGMPWASHEQCRSSLQATHLRRVALLVMTQARTSVVAALQGQDGGICRACMALLSVILSWDFRDPAHGLRMSPAVRPSDDLLQVKPGEAWRELLLAPDAFDWLTHLITTLGHPEHQQQLSQADSQCLASQSRNLLVRLCAVAGDIFPPKDGKQRASLGLQCQTAKDTYLARVLHPVLLCALPSQQSVQQASCGNQDPLLDACRAVAAAAPVHRANGFHRALPPGCGPQLPSATDLLLEAWSALLLEATMCGSPRDADLPEGVAEAAAGVFHALVLAALAEAGKGLDEDESEGEADAAAANPEANVSSVEEDRLAQAAAIGRTALEPCAGLLAGLIQQRLEALPRLAQSGQDASQAQEELCWLACMGAALVADAGDGETPLVPNAVADCCQAAAAAGRPDTIQALCQLLLQLLTLPLNPAASPCASPRLMEAAVAAAARLCGTYLMPSSELLGSLGHFFGSEGSGQQVVEGLLSSCQALLLRPEYTAEGALHKLVSGRLLRMLALCQPTATLLLHSPAYQGLAGGFAEQRHELMSLGESVLKRLAEALCLVAAAIPDFAESHGYTTSLLQSSAGAVERVSQLPAAEAGKADVTGQATILIQIWRGATQGMTAYSQTAMWALTQHLLQPLLSLQHIYRNHPRATCLLLKLAAGLVEAHISYLGPEDARQLFAWVLAALQQYARDGRRAHAGTVHSLNARLQEEANAEAEAELRALLRLLFNVTQRDLADFGTPAGQPGIDVAQMVFVGLDIVVPLMTTELLKFPALSVAYFQLLAHMLEVYPERVLTLPGHQATMLMNTLRFGLSSMSQDVLQASLEATAALARFHQLHTPPSSSTSAGARAALSTLLWALMQRMLEEPSGGDLVELAADAALPLILFCPEAFQTLGHDLVSSRNDKATESQLTASLMALSSSSTAISSNMDRPSRKAFRLSFSDFILVARSILQMR